MYIDFISNKKAFLKIPATNTLSFIMIIILKDKQLHTVHCEGIEIQSHPNSTASK